MMPVEEKAQPTSAWCVDVLWGLGHSDEEDGQGRREDVSGGWLEVGREVGGDQWLSQSS